MKVFSFRTILKRPNGIGTWHYVDTPIQAKKEFDTKGKVRVSGKINGLPFYGTLIPRGNGEHYIVLDKSIRNRVKIKIGDELKMEIWKDSSKREVIIPDDLQIALSSKEGAQSFFRDLAYSNKKAYVDWINNAKKEETREARISKAIGMLTEKKKLR